MRSRLSVLWLILLGMVLVDLWLRPFLGNLSILLWLSLLVATIAWAYYAYLGTQAWVGVAPTQLVVQVPFKRYSFSYGRIQTVSSSQLAQHYALKELNGRERLMVRPYLNVTGSMLTLNSFPPKVNKSDLPRLLLSADRDGLLLLTQDWIDMNRHIESKRLAWREQRGLEQRQKEYADHRSLAAKILDL